MLLVDEENPPLLVAELPLDMQAYRYIESHGAKGISTSVSQPLLIVLVMMQSMLILYG